jgi:teichuronic acid exporter
VPVTNKKIFKGVVWSLLDTFAKFAIKFFFALAITKILNPRDYGLMAYMGIFLGIAQWLSNAGFGFALIQKKDADDIDFSTAYLFNVTLSFFFFLLYFFSAPYISGFFREPELINIMRVLSMTLILNSLCYVHQIKLIKSIEFKQQAILNFSGSLISGIIGLTLAIMGYGYWALIFQTLIGTLINMVSLWIIVKWRPLLVFSFNSFREQFKFGSRVFVQGLLESIFREIHSTVIGRTYQTAALGNYSRGQKFYELFIVETGLAINKVLYPAMVKKTDEVDKHKNAYSTTYNILFFVVAPLSLFLILLSDSIIIVLLTEKWIKAAPFMQIYFFGGFIYILVYFNSITLLSANKPNLYLKMDLIRNAMMAIALLLTFKISIEAIIIGWLIVFYSFYVIYELMMNSLSYNDKGKYVKMLQVLVCLVPSLIFYAISAQLISSPLFLLVVNSIVQPVLYLMVMRISGFRVYKEFSLAMKPLLPGKIQFLL